VAFAGVTIAGATEPRIVDDVSSAWFGAEHVTIDRANEWGGWVDGNGPDSYQAVGICKNGTNPKGDIRWAGDRRGSFVYCSSGFAAHRFEFIYV
jgi:hypothetical protein